MKAAASKGGGRMENGTTFQFIARAARVVMLEPSSPQEAKDYTVTACEMTVAEQLMERKSHE
jgi:TPP-dependent indolepyruvate ferredoxin oxidoreductase alpha subunit